ncbi:MAG: molybdopterin-dependent oxidoreductase, partial [Pseudonocardiaceae bacterium]
KRTYPKPLPISEEILLDRERCVLCTRCTRFSSQIAGDPFIDMFDRGADQQVAVYRGEAAELDMLGVDEGDENAGRISDSDRSAAKAAGAAAYGGAGTQGDENAGRGISGAEPFHSYFSGNTIQICPVGALTSVTYRFRARPFDLVSAPTVCEHCSSGCSQRTDWRRSRVMRRLAGDDPEVNEEWNCDKGRFAFVYPTHEGRITTPMVRGASGTLEPASWSQALAVAAEGLATARSGAGVGVLTGGRLTVEDAYAYSVFARAVLGTNDIDFRARPHSGEEARFLADHVAGITPATGGLRYRDLDAAPVVLLAGLEPEEESPILFLRLRKASRRLDAAATQVYSIAPWASRGLEKLAGTLLEAAPGTETRVLDALTASDARLVGAAAGLRNPGAVILVGERLAEAPGAFTAVVRLARESGARLAWVPRRAGDRGAVDAGVLPGLLPGGGSVYDGSARAELERLWGCEPGSFPSAGGKDTDRMLRAAGSGEL